MNILVTGASGRIGSHLVPRLLAHGEAVRVLVRNEEQAQTFEELGAQSVIGDLLRPETLDQAAAGIDSVIHLAAFFRGASEGEARAVNYEGTLALAHAAQEAGVSKFVYISTNLVYGPGRGRPATEDDEPQPAADHIYPVSKLDAERALAQFYEDRKEDLCILRLAFVYGEGDPHLREALNMTRSWPGEKRLQTVHHVDVAQAILLSLTKERAGGRIYNVADDSPTPIAEIRQMHGLGTAEFPADGEVEDPWEGIVDTTKIKRQLGFKPLYPSIQSAQAAKAL